MGRLVIEGWVVARSSVQAIEVFLDERSLGEAYYGAPRRDVEAAFPDWDGSLQSGYIFHCPPRALEDGVHGIRLQVRAKNGGFFKSEFQINVQKTEQSEDFATIRRRMSRIELGLYQDMLDRLDRRPSFHLLLVVKGRIVPEKLESHSMYISVQAYRNWQLLVVTDIHEPAGLLAIVDRAGLRGQAAIVPADDAVGALVPFLTSGTPCLIGVLFPGDELGCDALIELAIAYGLHPEAQFFYADEDRISPSSQIREPFFKPDWSPDLLLSANYIGRPWFVTSDLFAEAAITPQSLSVKQGDYDAVLRCTELASGILHLPKLLCRRDGAKASEEEDERRVLLAAAVRRDIQAELLPGCIPGTWRLRRTTPVGGKVSIIIPTCAAHGYVATCLETLRSKTAYRNIEIICIDNIPPELPEWKERVREAADKVLDIPERFKLVAFQQSRH